MSERGSGTDRLVEDAAADDPPVTAEERVAEPADEPAEATRSGRWSSWRARRRAKPKATGFVAWLKELPILLAIAFVLALLIKTFLVQAFFIPSGSMETTLHGCPGCVADRILVNKLSYTFSDPQPGDIVVFRGEGSWKDPDAVEVQEPSNVFGKAWLWVERSVGAAPPDERDLVKRVIAVGGQTVQCCDAQNRVLVDGKPLDEPYVHFDPPTQPGADGQPVTATQQAFGPITVPKGRLWVMGDHRNGSADSRFHVTDQYQGTISEDWVVGRAFVVVWPFSRFHWLSHQDIQGLASGPLGLVAFPPVAALGVAVPISLTRLRRRRRDVLVGRDPPSP